MSVGLPLRFKYLCGQYGRVLVAVLILFSAVGFAGAAAGAAGAPEPTWTTVQTDQQAVSTTLTASATVSGNSTLYDRGATVADVPVYLLAATPNLTLRAVTDVPTDRRVAVTQDVVLGLSATRNDEVFWTERRELASTDRVVTDGSVGTTVTLDVARLARERLAAVRAAAGDVGTVRAQITVNTSHDTGSYTGSTNVSSPLTVTDDAYEFDTPQVTAVNHSTPVTRQVNVTTAGTQVGLLGTGISLPGRSLWVAVAGLVALGLAVVVRLVDRRIEDFDAFERQYETVRYAEWISRGKIPNTGGYVRVPIETLLDLVDIAIDSEKRVIHDESKGVYAVVDGNLLFEFRSGSGGDGHMYEFGLAPIGETDEASEWEPREPETLPQNGGAGDVTE